MQKVFQYIQKYKMIEENDSIIVGVSGGADSVCLLFVLLELRERIPFSIKVVHIEHGIRGQDSLDDADFVDNLCKEKGIPFYLYPADVVKAARDKKISVEEAGREARYEAFADVMERFGGNKIAVAHHANDQAETILWNLVRGSGLKGLCGTRPVRDCIIRPLLGTSRSEIEAYLRERKIPYRTDSTNLSDDYTRNKLRLHVLPYLEKELNGAATAHIAETGRHLQKIEDYMEDASRREAKDCTCISEGRAVIDTDNFAKKPEVIQEYIFRLCLKEMGCGLRDIGSIHIDNLMKLPDLQPGRRIQLPGGYTAKRLPGQISIFREEEDPGEKADTGGTDYELQIQVPGTYIWKGKRVTFSREIYENQIIEEKPYTKWLDYDKIYNAVSLRSRRSGDYFITNREGGKKKLKSYFIDEKIPQDERDRILLLADGSHIMWIVGYRISEAYKVTKDTKIILKIQVKQEAK